MATGLGAHLELERSASEFGRARPPGLGFVATLIAACVFAVALDLVKWLTFAPWNCFQDPAHNLAASTTPTNSMSAIVVKRLVDHL